MQAYIDISFIFHILLCLSSLKFTKIIANKSLSKKQTIIFTITSIVLYLNVLIIPFDSLYINIFYHIVIFYFFLKKDFIIMLLTYLFTYYSQISIIRIFTNNIYIYKGIIMINNPISFMYIFILPILQIILAIVVKSIKSIYLLKKYRFNVKLTIKNKNYNIKAYFDSGNTMKYKDLPVVFLTNELKDKNIQYEKFLVEGIGVKDSDYLKGKILFNKKERDVYFAYINKRSFNGCKCLLNVYLLG